MTYQLRNKLTKSYLQVPRTTPFSGKTIGQAFNDMADRKPDKEMYVFYADKERITCRQIQQESHQFAGGLLKLGLKKGDAIGMWGGNHYEWLLSHFAAIQLGLIVVHFRLEFTLEVVKTKMLKHALKAIVLTRSPVDLFDSACKIIPELRTNPADNLDCISIPSLKYVINAGTATGSGALSVNDIMDMGKDVDKAKVREACEKTDIDDRVVVFFTSGSSGSPKAATHSHKSLYMYEFIGQLENCAINYENKSTWAPRFAQIPALGTICGQDGLLFPIYVEDGTSIMVAPDTDMEMFIKAVQDERITGSIFLIHHLNDMVNYPKIDDYDFSSFELGVFGGSSIPPSLLTRAKKYMKHVLMSYAATEGFAATQTPKDPIEILQAPAYPLVEGSEVKIVDDEGHIVPINTIGEICFRGEMMFMYYWGDEEKTRAAISSSGWYSTGDAGCLDENGYLRLEGRKQEFIIKAGMNLAPANVERVIDQHPAVNNVVVIGVPNERVGEEVCACVRLHPSAKATKEELIELCKGKVSPRAVPDYVLFIEAEFPVNEIGKARFRNHGSMVTKTGAGFSKVILKGQSVIGQFGMFERKKIAEQARISLGLKLLE